MQNKERQFSELSVGVRRLLQSRIPPTEKVLACYEIIYAGQNIGFVLTERRGTTATVHSGMSLLVNIVLGEHQEEVVEVLLEDVSTVVETKIHPWLVVSLYGEDMQRAKMGFFFYARDDFYNRFIPLLRNAIAKCKGDQPSSTPSDPSVRIRQLVALRRDGLISEDEFQRKRTEILKEL